MVTDAEAAQRFQQHSSDMMVRQTAITSRDALVVEYQAEHTRIQEAAARFGLFLKKHSITPYNDATEAYLDMLIQERSRSRASGTIPTS